MGDERAHAELTGEWQRLAVVTFSLGSVLTSAGRRDITDEAKGVGLASPRPQPAGERQCLSGVAGGLVDPPGREGGHPRAQKNEGRPDVNPVRGGAPNSPPLSPCHVQPGTMRTSERSVLLAFEME